MSFAIELQDFRGKILEQVKKAAEEGDVAAIARMSSAAERCEAFIEEDADLGSRIEAFSNALWASPRRSPMPELENPATENTDSINPRRFAKKEGANTRAEWVKKVASCGTVLAGSGKRYYTRLGMSVAVATANEARDDRWWLGIKDEPCDIVVLLCRDSSRRLHDLVVPVADLGTVWKNLSRNKGNIEFNIRKEASEFLLKVPRSSAVSVTKYLGNFKPLSTPAK